MNSDVLTLFKHGITLTRSPKDFVRNHFSDKHSVYIYFHKDFLVLPF